MKKIACILTALLPLLLAACATTKASEEGKLNNTEGVQELTEQNNKKESTENTAAAQSDSLQSDTEEAAQSNDSIAEKAEQENSISEKNYIESAETEQSVKQDAADENTEAVETDVLHQELEAIVEPEIIDLEPPLEAEDSQKEQEIDSEAAEEKLEDVEELPPVEVKLENNSESTIKEEVPAAGYTASQDTALIVENKDNGTDKITYDSTDNLEEVTAVEDEDEISVVDEDDVQVIDGENSDTELSNEQVIIPSRSVNLKKFEYVDVIYPGKGWIFMGLTDNSKDLSYNGRQIGTENTVFSLQARNSGTKILHFYKNDALTGNFIDDYVEVIISSEKGSSKTHIQAPEYVTPLPEEAVKKQQETTEKSAAVNVDSGTEDISGVTDVTESVQKPEETAAKTEVRTEAKAVETKPVDTVTAASVSEDTAAEIIVPDTAELLTDAQKALENQDYKKAISRLNTFLEYSTTGRDQALYLLGQIYETPGENQNIQEAINSYSNLTANYPASKYWDASNKRIIYLKRFYLEGR